MKRVIVRPRIQISLLVAGFIGWTLLGVTYFTSGDVVAKRQWFGVAMGGMCLVGGPAGIWRALRLGIVINADGLRIRSLDSRDRLTPWSAVESIECVQIGARAGMPLYAPVVRLAADAGAIPLTALSSYSRPGAECKARRLACLKPGAGYTDGEVTA